MSDENQSGIEGSGDAEDAKLKAELEAADADAERLEAARKVRDAALEREQAAQEELQAAQQTSQTGDHSIQAEAGAKAELVNEGLEKAKADLEAAAGGETQGTDLGQENAGEDEGDAEQMPREQEEGEIPPATEIPPHRR